MLARRTSMLLRRTLKHDELCEMVTTVQYEYLGCLCATRAYESDPFVWVGVVALKPEVAK